MKTNSSAGNTHKWFQNDVKTFYAEKKKLKKNIWTQKSFDFKIKHVNTLKKQTKCSRGWFLLIFIYLIYRVVLCSNTLLFFSLENQF